MTAYTFIASASQEFVNWNTPSVWAGGMFPNSTSADVIIPEITTSDGSRYNSIITISSGQSYSANSVSITDNILELDGALSVTNAVNLMTGAEIDMDGTLSAGSLSLEDGSTNVQGSGLINVSGTILNDTSIIGNGLTVSASAFTNDGKVQAASGNLTLTVSPGGFSNFSGSTLAGGTYSAGFEGNTTLNTLAFNVGGLIVTDAANIQLNGGGSIQSFDSNSSEYVPIQSSLTTIAQTGMLSLAGQTFNWGNGLTDDGAITLTYSSSNVLSLNAPQLTVSSSGTVSGVGTIAAPINNSGIITAGFEPGEFVLVPLPPPPNNNLLEIDGPVTGTGMLEIGAPYTTQGGFSSIVYNFATLQLDDPVSENVVFLPSTIKGGTLILNDVAGFTGTIAPGPGANIVVSGVSYSSVTGYNYSGNAAGGTLTVQEAGNTIALNFSGQLLDTGNFTLSAGPQPLSTSPPSLLIAVNPPPEMTAATNATYIQYGAAIDLSPSLEVTETASQTLDGATVSITGGTFADDGDLLTAPAAGTFEDFANRQFYTITASYSPSTEALTLSGTAPSSFYNEVLQSIAFSSSSSDPTDNGADLTRTITWTVNDGLNTSAPVSTALGIVTPDPSTPVTSNPSPPISASADMIMRDGSNGDYEIYDIGNNAILGAYSLGQVNVEWAVAGLGGFDGADTSDMLLRNSASRPLKKSFCAAVGV